MGKTSVRLGFIYLLGLTDFKFCSTKLFGAWNTMIELECEHSLAFASLS